ncbi:N-acetylmuramoyl-L-alanine amidase family protein [Xiamenia xianingshaonis]|uniref:N-acetylmuramoyl-L-alanine amidase family protein n=2 Tax=Xiamenia xianingshaonis TaxID=2682776 RepID=A0A9E6MRE2_9ACTN|nr:N-acetylmuramoyl-L-alanine amidase family protein [Xiamenia xianingshaonis]QTU84635.1 N-acetylmuramoyl-L-alanine amidase family protein [Xiamenia xianingshaonis]
MIGVDKQLIGSGVTKALVNVANASDPITTGTPIPVKITLDSDGTVSKNYVLPGAQPDGSLTVDVPVVTNGVYDIEWDTGSGDVITSSTAPTSGLIAYTGMNLTNSINGAMKATFTASTPGATAQQITAASAFDIDWFVAGTNTPVVNELGRAAAPITPGTYTAKFRVKGSTDYLPNAELTLTVQADLAGQVKAAAENSDPITVTVQNRYPGDVKLKYENGLTAEQLEQQIWDNIQISLKGYGDKPVVVENPSSLFDLKPINFVTGSKANGKVELSYPQANGMYTGVLTLEYSFGTPFPTFSELPAVTYNPNGYNPEKLVPNTIKDENGKTLQVNKDYTVTAYEMVDGKEVEISELTNVGSYKVVVTPTVNVDGANDQYVGGSQALTQVINPLTLTAGNTSLVWDGKTPSATTGTFAVAYTGSPAKPLPTGGTISVDTKYPALVRANPSEAIASGKIITKAEYDSKTAEEKEGFWGYVEYANNTDATPAGSYATATVTFVNNYTGTLTQNFTITPSSIKSLNGIKAIAAAQLSSEFNPDNKLAPDDVKDPLVTYVDGRETKTLREGVDYRITRAYIDSNQSGLAPGVTRYIFDVEGLGNYSGTMTGTFTVTKQSLDDGAFAASLANPKEALWYNFGKEVEPANGIVVKSLTDTVVGIGQPLSADQYVISYENNVNATSEDAPAYVVITGVKDYAGQLKVPYQIDALSLDGASASDIVLNGATDLVYNGQEQKPEVAISESSVIPSNEGYKQPIDLKNIVDQITYDTYENNINAGTGYVVIAGKGGNIVGSVKVPFTIAQADIANAEVTGPEAPVAPGTSLAEALNVTLGGTKLGAEDYTVSSDDAVPGAVKATVTGVGNLTGSADVATTVLYDVAGLSLAAAPTSYNGQSQTPVITASYKDAEGKTVEVPASALNVVAGSYVNAGKYSVKVAGNTAAGWGGETTVEYTIAPATVTAKPQVSYDAAGLPVVTVPGLTSSDFTYKPDAATKTITVTYKGNYKGTATVAYVPTAKPVTPAQPAAGKTGWVGSGNDWAYYENGVQVKGGWKLIGGEWYHFEKSGKMTNTKWFQDADGTWYMLNQSHKGEYGAMLTGWQKDGGEWYYFNKSGAMQSGWAKVDGEWYLLNSKHDGTFGAMLTGWQKVGGKWYYMDASGAMAANEWVGPYWVNTSGVWTATRG